MATLRQKLIRRAQLCEEIELDEAAPKLMREAAAEIGRLHRALRAARLELKQAKGRRR